MLHVIGARCVAHDLQTNAPWPLERTCWRQFATQWGDCKKSRIAPLNAIIIIIIVIIWMITMMIYDDVDGDDSHGSDSNHSDEMTQSTVWQDMSRPLYSSCEQDTVACCTPEANWHHGLCTLRLQRSGTDGPPHPPGLSHLAETETPVMATRWVNHQQAVGNGGRPAPHHPIPGNMWTESLSTADGQQKKKKK